MVCLNHFIRIFCKPEVDFYPLTIDLELCTLFVHLFNRTMREHLSDREWTNPFGLEFTRKQAQPRLEQKHQIPNCEFAPFNLLVMLLLHLSFVEG